MRMKLMLAAALAAALVGCGDIQGNGEIVEQELSVGAFAKVTLAEGLQGDITMGPEASVKIRGDSNLLEYIHLELKDGVLTSQVTGGLSLMPSEPIVVTAVTPTLTELKALNATHLSASNIDTESLTVSVSGRAVMSISGTAQKLTLSATLNSQADAAELVVEQASIDVSGGSDVFLHVTQEVSGKASGGSDITVRGNPPQADIATSGGAKVHFK
jgi:putative autotransporter adhesin-like protein